jgi:hypothetical protein
MHNKYEIVALSVVRGVWYYSEINHRNSLAI